MKIGWDGSHGEFSINDYYYFSKLLKYAEKEGLELEEVESFWKLQKYDVIVFNYPEKAFKAREISRIKSLAKKGKKIIFAAYYNNFDNVAAIINRAVAEFGIKINYDIIKDPEHNVGDEFYPIVEWGGLEIVLPCSASVEGEPFIAGKNVFAARKGNVITLGTCVFWDNYCIDLLNNKEFAIRLLSWEL